ncbi:hypothetical protein Peur_027710 [Populus x canadensis]
MGQTDPKGRKSQRGVDVLFREFKLQEERESTGAPREVISSFPEKQQKCFCCAVLGYHGLFWLRLQSIKLGSKKDLSRCSRVEWRPSFAFYLTIIPHGGKTRGQTSVPCINKEPTATKNILTWTGSMGDQECSWSRSVTSIARWRGAGLRSPQEGEPTSKFVVEGAAQAAAPAQF